MKLIEKKCPNCGANLEFKDSDKSCKCGHCGSSFEIERDTNISDLAEQFDLKPIGKVFSIFYTLSFIESAIIFIFVAVFIGVIFFQIKNVSDVNKNKETSLFGDGKLISDVKKLSSADIGIITQAASSKINHLGEGVNNSKHSYKLAGKAKREKIYVAYKKDGNYLIVIYKAIYHDFFHQEDSYTVFVPVVFENVREDDYFSLGDGDVSAPEFYFNSDKTSYTYGYSSFEEAYNGTLKPLESGYTITEK